MITALSASQIDEGVYIGAQIDAHDIPDLVKFGIVSLICNRPDGEEVGQSDFATIRKAAQSHGLVVHHVPVVSGALEVANIHDMVAALKQSPRPLFIYCRSGSRSRHLYHLAINSSSQ